MQKASYSVQIFKENNELIGKTDFELYFSLPTIICIQAMQISLLLFFRLIETNNFCIIDERYK